LVFNILPEDINVSKVRLKGYYSNNVDTFKDNNNLGYLPIIKSIHFIDASKEEREKIAYRYANSEQDKDSH
jgi:hypothetical protein